MHEVWGLVSCKGQTCSCIEAKSLRTCRAISQSDGPFGTVPTLVLQSAGSRVQWPGSWTSDNSHSIPFFRTGDLGRLGPNGLDILGRIDSQVKVGGEFSLLSVCMC